MSPPTIWGPAVWSLFHTFANKIPDNLPSVIYLSFFRQIKNICSVLPCPECANDATKFLANIPETRIATKENLIYELYIFHNYVNKKKQKPLFLFSNLDIYNNSDIYSVFRHFLNNFHTRGNMKLLTESFQRQLILKKFKSWFRMNIQFFLSRPPYFTPLKI